MSAPDSRPRPFLSSRAKIAIYLACWLVALIATNPRGNLAPLVYMFPLGLFAFWFPNSTHSGGWVTLFGVVLFYLAHANVYFRARTRTLTMIMLAVLVLALICNVSGCRRMINTH